MQTLRTWAELADWLEHPTHPDIATLLQLRRDQLRPLGDLIDIGTFIVVQPGDTVGGIEAALGVAITSDGSPTWEWVIRHGSIFEAPIILSDSGWGHVLIVPETEGVDPRLLSLCRDHA